MQDLILEAIEEHKFMLKHENKFFSTPLLHFLWMFHYDKFLLSKNE